MLDRIERERDDDLVPGDAVIATTPGDLSRMIEFEVADEFGLKVVIRGPIAEHARLSATVENMVGTLRDRASTPD